MAAGWVLLDHGKSWYVYIEVRCSFADRRGSCPFEDQLIARRYLRDLERLKGKMSCDLLCFSMSGSMIALLFEESEEGSVSHLMRIVNSGFSTSMRSKNTSLTLERRVKYMENREQAEKYFTQKNK